MLLLTGGAGLYACNSKPVAETAGASAIRAIRNNKHIMDAREAPFIVHPTYKKFSICHGHTCEYTPTLSLSDSEWQGVRAIFRTAGSPAEEREQIRQAIAILEQNIGSKTGTASDLAENRAAPDLIGQMDCVDESTNSSVYLAMMQRDGLLRWHRVQHRVNRGVATLQFPHFTAVIRDMQSGVPYAVDSWFLDNGEPPFIVPLDEWKRGWRPDPVTSMQSGTAENL